MVYFLLSLWIFIFAGSGMLLFNRSRKICDVLFLTSLIIACGCGLASGVLVLLSRSAPELKIPMNVPFGELYLGLDALSAFFILAIMILSLTTGVFGYSHLRDASPSKNVGLQYSFFYFLILTNVVIVTSKNAILFLMAWELMTVSSYFFVTFYDEREDVRKAGYLYLIATHVCTFFLLVMFLVMGHVAGSMDFDSMKLVSYSPMISGILFVLAMIGFGVKAGFIPLHIWLPYAHPVAPSHISAMLSGIIIKMGIYGLARFIFLVHGLPLWCGVVLLLIGCVSGVGGVLYALGQHEVKKLLAYHSIENIGIIALGLGIGFLGNFFHLMEIALIGYAGALLHVFNHALFKGLLFLSAGSLIRSTHTGRIDHLGGLLKCLPWTGHLFLIGSLSICGLPLFNGFISEWMIFRSLFEGTLHFNIFEAMIACLGIISLALIGGLAALCFAKVFAAIFLGTNRSHENHGYKESPPMMIIPMVALAGICLWIGLAPQTMVSFSLRAAENILQTQMSPLYEQQLLQPFSSVIQILLIVIGFAGLLAVLRKFNTRAFLKKETETWGCGYAALTPRMQYTASSFAQPILRLFRAALCLITKENKPAGYFPQDAQLSSEVTDASEHLIFRPLFDGLHKCTHALKKIQNGYTQMYLLYILFLLLGLLIWKFH